MRRWAISKRGRTATFTCSSIRSTTAQFVPMFTSSVDEAIDQTYTPDGFSGSVHLSVDDPVSINGVLLNDDFRSFSAVIPSGGQAIETLAFRFTAKTNSINGGVPWRNLLITTQGVLVGQIASSNQRGHRCYFHRRSGLYGSSIDVGIRSRLSPGMPVCRQLSWTIASSQPCRIFKGSFGSRRNRRFFGVSLQ